MLMAFAPDFVKEQDSSLSYSEVSSRADAPSEAEPEEQTTGCTNRAIKSEVHRNVPHDSLERIAYWWNLAIRH